MKRADCGFEHEALAAVMEGRWPGAADAALRQHVSQCAVCAEVVQVVAAMEEARDFARAEAAVPDSGLVWRRAQIRARREAARAAARPINAVQVLAAACLICLLGACFGATSTWFQSTVKSAGSFLGGLEAASFVPQMPSILAGHGLLILGGAAAVFLIPAALCFALLRD
jgi:hypothetical protein